MKKILSKLLYIVILSLGVFLLGLFIPVLLAIIGSLTTSLTFTDFFISVPFWILTTIGLICSIVVMRNLLKNIP